MVYPDNNDHSNSSMQKEDQQDEEVGMSADNSDDEESTHNDVVEILLEKQVIVQRESDDAGTTLPMDLEDDNDSKLDKDLIKTTTMLDTVTNPDMEAHSAVMLDDAGLVVVIEAEDSTHPTELRRQQAVIPPQSQPGAFHMPGTADPATAVHSPTGGQAGEEAVIDGAFLVVPEEEGLDRMESNEPLRGPTGETIVGQIVENAPSKRSSFCRFWLISVAIVIMLSGISVASVLARRNQDTSNPDPRDSAQSDSLILLPPFRDDLPTKSFRDIEDIGGPLYFANKWMVEDPYLETYSKARQLQRYILAATYYGTNGDNWHRKDGWLDYEVSECEWFHQTFEEELINEPVCDDQGNLRLFALASNNLQGDLPDMSPFQAVAFTPHVFGVDLSHNNITGKTLALHDGVNVEVIVLSNNSFDSLAPATGVIGSNIRVLKVDNNRIQMIATGIAWYLFPNVEIYNVTGNRIEGAIDHQIKVAKKMRYAGAGHNPWGGPVPSEIGTLVDLEELDLSGNANMEGTIPTELGLLTNLRRVDLTGSMFTGELPTEWCQRNGTQSGGFRMEIYANCSMVQCCE